MITEISERGETAENQGEIGFDARPNEKPFLCVGDFQVCHAGDGSGNDECAENENRNEAESVGAGDGESVENSDWKDIDLKKTNNSQLATENKIPVITGIGGEGRGGDSDQIQLTIKSIKTSNTPNE